MAAPSDSPQDPETGRVVDPEVLAERRARRSGAAGDGGQEPAEPAMAELERQLAEAEARLAEAEQERATPPPEAEHQRGATLLEQERQRHAVLLEHGRAAVSARESALRVAEQELVARAQELRTVRDEAEGHRAALRQAESELGVLRGRAVGLEAELDQERRRRVELEALAARERARVTAESAEAEAATRATLARGQDALRAGAEEAQRTLQGLRAAWGSTATELEARVAAERGARHGAERELEAERQARAAAEAAGLIDRTELAEREALSGQLDEALDQLRAELDAARRQHAEHAEHHAAVRALVGELVDAANGVRARFEAELEAFASRRDEQLESERAAFAVELAAAQERLEGLHGQLQATVSELRERLAEEEAARTTAEEALAAAGAEHAAAEQRATAVIDELRSELGRSEEAPEDDPRPGPPPTAALLPPADHPALRRPEAPAVPDEPPAVVADLMRAAERLRAAGEALDAPAAEPEAVAAAPAVEPESVAAAPADEPGAVADLGEDPGEASEPEAQPAPEPAPADPATEFGTLPAVLDAATAAGPWCASALAALADVDGPMAERLLLSLLAVQGPRATRDVAYELELPTLGRHQVWVRAGDGVTVLRGVPRVGDELSFTVSGAVAALSGLAAGTARRRLPGAAVHGRRWRLRRLLRALRAPVSLEELRRAGARPHPGDLLALLGRGVPVEAVAGNDFAVALVVTDADGGPARTLVRAAPDGRLTVITAAPESLVAHATVTTDSRGLLGLLAGTAATRVEGDTEAVELLRRWLLEAQGVTV